MVLANIAITEFRELAMIRSLSQSWSLNYNQIPKGSGADYSGLCGLFSATCQLLGMQDVL